MTAVWSARSQRPSNDASTLAGWLARARRFRPREPISVGNDEPPQAYFIRSGWAARSRLLVDGRRQIVEVLLVGDHSGPELTPFQRRASQLAAFTACEVASISLAEVNDAMTRDGDLAAALLQAAHLKAATAEELLVSLGRRTALERAAHLFCGFLLRQGGAQATSCEMPLHQPDLADILGLSAVHTNRTLQTMRRSDLADVSGGRLATRDLGRLRAIGDFDPAFLEAR